MTRKRGGREKEGFGETDAASGLGPFKCAAVIGHLGGDVRTAGDTGGGCKRCSQGFAPLLLVSRAHSPRCNGAVARAPLCTHHLPQCQAMVLLELKLRHPSGLECLTGKPGSEPETRGGAAFVAILGLGQREETLTASASLLPCC